MKFTCSLFVISLSGIILENTMVRSELTCDGHDLRAMMVQLLTLKKEFADYKMKSENLIQSLSKRHTKCENDIQLLNKTVQENGTSHIGNENVTQGLGYSVQWMNETIQETIHNQTSFNKVIQGLSNTCQGFNDTVHAQNASIQETLKNLTKSGKVIQDFNTALQETLKNHTSELAALKDLSSHSSSDELVGFIATKQNISFCNGIVEFETTLTNNGSVYNSCNGYFTAPYSGLYLFSVQLCFFNYGYNTKYQIYSPNRNQYFSDTQYLSVYTSCTSLTTTAYLTTNDQLYVNCTSYNTILGTSKNDYWNMFSGVLINTDD